MQQMTDERFCTIALNMIWRIGHVKTEKIKAHFGGVAGIFGKSREEILASGLNHGDADAILSFKLKDTEREIKRCTELDVRIVLKEDAEYPALLSDIHDPPPVLYMAGLPYIQRQNPIAIIGTRNATHYGKSVTEALVKQAASCGTEISIISGMAKGIDSIGHEAALANNIYTAAILGFGLQKIEPRDMWDISRRISRAGTLISEFPLDFKASKISFPRRNRIISGMSRAVIVVEAGERSGTLITVDFALEQGRDVFAVPGDIFAEKSKGVNRIISEGAKVLGSFDDVLKSCGHKPSRVTSVIEKKKAEKAIETLSGAEREVYEKLGLEKKHIDIIAIESNISVTKLSSLLTIMELKGAVKQLEGKNFVRA